MKQKDIALITVVVFVSAIISLFVSKSVFTKTSNQQSVEVVQPMTASFAYKEDSAYFTNGFDPTKLIQVSPNNNTNPFPASTNQ